jgi:hydrogenase assembly chaperone HypC/HupF
VTEHRICSCVTCSDQATPMRVVDVNSERSLALGQDGEGERHTVDVMLVGDVETGDTLLVHAGVAIARLDEPQAGR